MIADFAAKLRDYARDCAPQPTVRFPLAVFLAFRALFSLLGLALFSIGLVPKTADPVTRPYFGVAPVVDGAAGALLGVWQRFDAIHFMRIAAGGYASTDLAAFPPLFPLLTRLVGVLVGGDLLLAGLVVANVACLLLLLVFYRLLLEEGFGESVARRAIIYLLAFPTAFFLFVPYSESLFTLLCVVTFREARRGRWLLAGLAAIGAALTRLAGVCLVVVLAVALLRRANWQPARVGWRMLYAALPALGSGAFLIWLGWRGFPSTVELQRTFWHRSPAWPWQGIVDTVARSGAGVAYQIEYLDLALVVLMLGLGVAAIRRLPLLYGAYFWSNLLFNLSQVRSGQPLSGQARFCLTLFPAFLVLALLARSPWRNRAIVYPSLILLVLLAGQYMIWGWVG